MFLLASDLGLVVAALGCINPETKAPKPYKPYILEALNSKCSSGVRLSQISLQGCRSPVPQLLRLRSVKLTCEHELLEVVSLTLAAE